jgi:hypothetical protein
MSQAKTSVQSAGRRIAGTYSGPVVVHPRPTQIDDDSGDDDEASDAEDDGDPGDARSVAGHRVSARTHKSAGTSKSGGAASASAGMSPRASASGTSAAADSPGKQQLISGLVGRPPTSRDDLLAASRSMQQSISECCPSVTFWNHTYNTRAFEEACTQTNKTSRALSTFAGDHDAATEAGTIATSASVLIEREAFFDDMHKNPRMHLSQDLTNASKAHLETANAGLQLTILSSLVHKLTSGTPSDEDIVVCAKAAHSKPTDRSVNIASLGIEGMGSTEAQTLADPEELDVLHNR